MIVSEAAQRVLSLLEQEDEEEYTFNLAVTHVVQALHELSEENEFKFHNVITQYDLTTPEAGTEPGYWNMVPGRVPLTSVLGVNWSGFSYIKRGWIDVDAQTNKFRERTFEEMMDTFGDNEGTPEAWALDGEYFHWRPIAASGVSHVIRLQWQQIPADPAEGDEPIMLAQIPYGVIYRACMIASVWLLDDNRIPIFKALSQEAFDRYNIRHSMVGDGPRYMETFNG
jgi:hypothetical protein